MSNRAVAISFSFMAGILGAVAIEHNPAMFAPAAFAALQAIQYIALQICDAIKTGKDTA